MMVMTDKSNVIGLTSIFYYIDNKARELDKDGQDHWKPIIICCIDFHSDIEFITKAQQTTNLHSH